MTYEELLEKINKELRYCTCEGSGWGGNNCFYEENQAWITLRAVVELHKPQGNFGDTYIDGKPTHPYCPECIDPDVYPCPTIQAIQEQLK